VSIPEKPLRSDARRNREAMVKAAREVFAEHGVDAPLDLVARAAGVGRATQHRHFPTRDSLLLAIFEDNLETLERLAEEADPKEAYVELLLATVGMHDRDRAFLELIDRRVPPEIQESMAQRFLGLMGVHLRRAQRAGRVRRDLTTEDTLLLVDMLGGAAHPPGNSRPDGRMDRALQIVLDSITPAGGQRTRRMRRKAALKRAP
jgi:AcrR family transcriptional regulator